MNLPPAWKVRRELYTAFDQGRALLLWLLSPFRGLTYDHFERRSLIVHEGQAAAGPQMVIVLLYQPYGMPDSQWHAIDYLIANGQSLMVVANGGLPVGDVNRLKGLCWRVLERKNIGYDFGGYRSGLNYLRNQAVVPEILTLMNDSIFFPVLQQSDWLHRTAAAVTDFGGAVCLGDVNDSKGPLALSYWLTLRKPLLKSPAFWRFWQRYVPTGNKTYTVKHGERGLSFKMHQEGFSAHGKVTLQTFMATLRSASTDQLCLTLTYAAFTDLNFKENCEQLLNTVSDSDEWRSDCLNFVERVARRRNFLHSFCYAAVALLQVPFIKKGPMRLQVLMRQQYLRAVKAGHLPTPHPSILDEINKCTPEY